MVSDFSLKAEHIFYFCQSTFFLIVLAYDVPKFSSFFVYVKKLLKCDINCSFL